MNSLPADREFKHYCISSGIFAQVLRSFVTFHRFNDVRYVSTYYVLSFSYKPQLRFLRPHSFHEIFSNGRFEQWRISPTMLFQHLKYLLIIYLFMSNTFQLIKEQQLEIRVFTVLDCWKLFYSRDEDMAEWPIQCSKCSMGLTLVSQALDLQRNKRLRLAQLQLTHTGLIRFCSLRPVIRIIPAGDQYCRGSI